jgi:FtsZ-binding cell division protein ZapB
MTSYANKTDLYEAKAKYYIEKSEFLQAEVDQLKDSVFQYGIENTKLQIQREALRAALESIVEQTDDFKADNTYYVECWREVNHTARAALK